ncbi:ABC-2 type transport system ATP-binding protein/lipopolysaccharide transport system ATP-binding protein [Pseudomonas pohangensis]|uniref:ABC-2 type transport system ATP-binding protein/lipopolysaccharide transport system ATP-binding protein n=1 Tax=Pseudomonas pohangensis TaxID=364197 RepID=A0A1H2EFI7_9PSED|nr:ABC transporter ATP-binding protein [Pseudomonas pohangensis]SDT93794.1 ABC-2 type transport system ATP-binding protein/lipopolysaccharide transport system ATP-binding protein [Pseudomonas pohangensis]
MASLKFDKVSVSYPVYNSRSLSLRNHLIRVSTGGIIERESGRVQMVTALRDVSFQLDSGDAVGLIGHNGSGKSTLLRTMAGIYTPTTGKVLRSGRVATMLDLGAGMDQELSGYENITRMCLLMGESSSLIKQHIEEIENFTQLGDFLQMPVRTYSSGMLTRLIFAISTSTRPDILLVDEIFGLGDVEFQEQAQERMDALISSVGIFVLASHFGEIIKHYCNRFFRLEHGVLTECGREDF